MTEEEIAELEKKAEAGCDDSERILTEGYALGENGIQKNLEKLIDLAEKNWAWSWAQEYVSEGYAYGKYGFQKDHNKLKELANKDWWVAKYYLDEIEED